jgi:hypothetical protein
MPTITTSLSRTYGPALLDRGEFGLAAAGGQGQRLAGGGAHDRGVAGVAEVGVGVDVDQPDPAAAVLGEAPHGQRPSPSSTEQSPPRTSGKLAGLGTIAPIRSARRVE